MIGPLTVSIVYLGVLLVSVVYALLPLFIYWRCGRILRHLQHLERILGIED
jgi:hypothetical protein